MSEADAQVWQGRRRDAVIIPLDVVAQHQAIDIRLVGNHSRSGFGCPDSMTRRGDLLRQIGQRNEAHAQRSGGAFVGARRRDIGRDHEVGSIRIRRPKHFHACRIEFARGPRALDGDGWPPAADDHEIHFVAVLGSPIAHGVASQLRVQFAEDQVFPQVAKVVGVNHTSVFRPASVSRNRSDAPSVEEPIARMRTRG